MSNVEKEQPDSVVIFGSYRLDVGTGRLWRGKQEVKVTPKAFTALCYFADHPGQLVTKDDLFAAVWPQTIVTEATLASCIQELRQALRDDAKAPRYIETVHRRGFRFIATLTPTPPVISCQLSVVSQTEEGRSQQEGQQTEQEPEKNEHVGAGPRTSDAESPSQSPVLSPQSFDSPIPSPQPLAPARFWSSKGLMLTGLLLLVGTIVAVQYLSLPISSTQSLVPHTQPALPLPNKPSIVVLPLVNLSNDPEQEYFSDGLTEDLIQTLSRIQNLFVIARQSAFTYKGKATKIQDIGRELGVRYVLEGSVRKAENRVRISVRLVEASTGVYRWDERYERPLGDIFAVQDEIVQKIATTLNLQLTMQEQGWLGRKRTDHVEAYDALLRGVERIWLFTPEANLQARQFFEQAITLDPQYGQGYLNLGFTYFSEWRFKWSVDLQNLERALEFMQHALALDNFYAPAHSLIALIYAYTGQLDRALTEIQQAIALDPNNAENLVSQAEVLSLAGRAEEAVQTTQQAIRLNPHAPLHYLSNLGWAYHLTERYDESIVTYQQLLARSPAYPLAYPVQAYNYAAQWIAQQSQDPKTLDQAYDAAQNAVTLNDAYSIAHTALGWVYLWQKQYDLAITELERAVTLDGNYVCGVMSLAYGLSQGGRIEEAVQVGKKAMSLKALPSDDRCLVGVASAYALAGRLEEAAALEQRLLKQFPNFLWPHLDLAAVYSELGRDTEARAEAAEVLRINPQFSLEIHKERVPIKDPALLERHIAALRKAGLK